jgi:hypothetical protein
MTKTHTRSYLPSSRFPVNERHEVDLTNFVCTSNTKVDANGSLPDAVRTNIQHHKFNKLQQHFLFSLQEGIRFDFETSQIQQTSSLKLAK